MATETAPIRTRTEIIETREQQGAIRTHRFRSITTGGMTQEPFTREGWAQERVEPLAREIVEDLALHQVQPVAPSSAMAEPPTRASAVRQSAQILGCPAHDEADELALLMLRQLLDPTRYSFQVISAEILTAEVLSAVEEQHVGLICIASLPPGALAPTRYLCKRLRARFPECKIVVGRWGLREDWDKPQALLREAGADQWTRNIELDADRGTIFDRNGEELEVSIPAASISVNPKLVTDPAGTVRTLATVLGLTDQEQSDLYAALVA